MKPKTDKAQKITDEWKDKYLRALADYQNLERRVGESGIRDKKNAAREMILKFLPVIDDLIKAQKLINNDGLKLIINKTDDVLKSEGVTRVNSLNQKFNPAIMECAGIAEGKKDDEVVSEIRPAYMMNGEILQTAQVIVSKIDVSHPDENGEQTH